MASKKKVVRKSAEGQALKTVRKLTLRAQRELGELIEEHKAGTLKRAKLDTGLKKLRLRLDRIFIYEFRI
jgi:hypothetical protein